MAPDLGGWIHNFTVTDTQTHRSGYTLYKITSIVFPRSVPQALTQIVVWRRFHDIKRLHRDLKRRHKSLQLYGYLPEPIDCSFFKRFEKNVIQKRKEYILQLLDFAAQHSALYKCHSFVQFFNESTPPNKLKFVQEAVSGIQRNLDIIKDEVDFAKSQLNDKNQAFKKEDDDKLLIEVKKVECNDVYNIQQEHNQDDEEEEEEESLKIEYTTNINNHPKHFLTPMASIESDDSDYIYIAALEFSQAVQAEANLEYSEAHIRYKSGVDILLHGSKDDHNDERKFIAKAKISKYLARAEDIHERFLKKSPRTLTYSPSANFQLALDVSGNTTSDSSGLYLERPWNHMAKYKVNYLLGNKVLHVTCITEPYKPAYVMKGIEKPSSNSPTQTVFLPQHVPYMVDLFAFFQSDQKIFLLLKLALGGKLVDFIHSFNVANTEKQFKDLSLNATPSKDTPDKSLEIKDLVNNSKQLLQAVSNTLKVVKDLEHECPRRLNSKSPRRSPRKIAQHRPIIHEKQLKQWAQQLLVAIHSLHEKGVMLCDLNMDNLLLNENGQLLLTYFYQNEGVSSDSCIHKALSPKALEEHFVAPERPLTFRSDWWSYGVILYELFLGLSFKAAHPGQIDLYGYVQYPENMDVSAAAKDLLEQLLQQIPDDRLDHEKIKQHQFFEGTNWEDVKHKGYSNQLQK